MLRLLKPRSIGRWRTAAARVFDRLVSDVEADLGGHDELSTIERALVEGFAGAAVVLQHLNTQLALGQQIDLSEHAQAVSAMVRVASRLAGRANGHSSSRTSTGLQRRAKDVGPSLSNYLREPQS